jgi:DNA-binding response OmpR family regulator
LSRLRLRPAALATSPIAVFLLDDHEVVRIPAPRPNVAVLDVQLPDGDGVSVCRDIRSQLPDVACLMLTPVVYGYLA